MSDKITTDPRVKLIAEIEALTNTAIEIAPGAASVLATLQGAMLTDEEVELSRYTTEFSRLVLARIQKEEERDET